MSAPPYINDASGKSLRDLANITERYPSMAVVFNFEFDWSSDRLLRSFVASFANLYLDMTYWFADGIIEFVEEYGAQRSPQLVCSNIERRTGICYFLTAAVS
jgi:hypothetical protein